MSRFRAALLALGGLAIGAAAVLAWRARQADTPRAALQRLVDGIRAGDRHAIEQSVDVPRLAQSLLGEAQAAARAMGDTSGVDEATQGLILATLEQSIRTTLLDPTSAGRYNGITDVRQRGDTSWVGVRIRLEDGDSAALLHLQMTRVAAPWRVVGVDGLGPHVRAVFERRRGRAYEAAMRSDLRNLMSAEGAYFAAHATYTRALDALSSFSPTSGVSIEILEANRGGWRAVARHHETATICRVAVGASVPGGDVAGEVRCAGGG